MFRCLHCMFVCIGLHSLQWVGCMLLVAASLQLLQGCCLSRQCLPYSEVSDWGNNCVWAAASCWQRHVAAQVFSALLHSQSCCVRRRLQQQHCPVCTQQTCSTAIGAVSLSACAEWSRASCQLNNSVIFILKTPHVGLNRGTLSISFKEHCLWHFPQ